MTIRMSIFSAGPSSSDPVFKDDCGDRTAQVIRTRVRRGELRFQI